MHPEGGAGVQAARAANGATTFPSAAEYAARFTAHGGADLHYLAIHYRRFCVTKTIFESTWRQRGRRLLDIGAHFLHHSLLYALDGYAVTAVDLPQAISSPQTAALARASGITLIENDDLEDPAGLRRLPEGSFDVILFTEIIEHLTFNPVAMWRELHRLLAVGGRIVITTPNHYALGGRFWDLRRGLGRMGGGVTVDEIVGRHTLGQHWKEYSLGELRRYFELLSPDFVIRKALYVEAFDDPEARLPLRMRPGRFLCRAVPLLRPNLHMEVELTGRQHGIVAVPRW
ncbi:MAG TPA: methyltransferase domain-containing protein [Terriglobia bacterium]|nr:methyltransferase domain-containing protein [Terriglobia bacterium]